MPELPASLSHQSAATDEEFLGPGAGSRPVLALGANWCRFEAVLDAGCSGTPGSGKWMSCWRAVWERGSVGWTMVGKATRYSWEQFWKAACNCNNCDEVTFCTKIFWKCSKIRKNDYRIVCSQKAEKLIFPHTKLATGCLWLSQTRVFGIARHLKLQLRSY